MLLNRFAVITIVLCLVHIASTVEEWNYEESSDHGPSHWYNSNPNCNGTRQSPIDITNSILDNDLKEFVFYNYDRTPTRMVAMNVGHTIQVTLPNDTLMFNGGGLNDNYTFAQFHFHWGANNSFGSEHTINGKAYPGEIHFVHWHSGKYSSFSDSLKYPDGLAVLGVFVQAAENPNDVRVDEELATLTDYFHSLEFAQNKTDVVPFPVKNLFPANKEYYRYYGSLTTPGCDEIVAWTVFKNPIYLSNEQMERFRHFHNPVEPDEELDHTNRPVQPLNNRTVYHSVTFPYIQPDIAHTVYVTPASSSGFGATNPQSPDLDFLDSSFCETKLITMNMKRFASNNFLKALQFNNAGTLNPNFVLKNNGKSLSIKAKPNQTIFIEIDGGSLDFKYRLSEINIFWGLDYSDGSQHGINGNFASLEIQLLFWNSQKYSSYPEAQMQEDGVTVMSVLGRIKDDAETKPVMDEVIKRIDQVVNPGSEIDFPYLTLTSLLPNSSSYYSFSAPLTFPFCSNKIKKIVLNNPIQITPTQLQTLKKVVLTQKYRFVPANLPFGVIPDVVDFYNKQAGIHQAWSSLLFLTILYIIRSMIIF